MPAPEKLRLTCSGTLPYNNPVDETKRENVLQKGGEDMKYEQGGAAKSVAALNLAVMLFGFAAVIGRFVQVPSAVIAGGRVICSSAVLLVLAGCGIL